ncbi:MAG: phospholipase D family protein [Woeseiaceae bacterium]|nr:phospholipase D family protein [Woeseiaceae bacterium]
MSRSVAIFAAALLAALVSACSSIDYDYPREPSYQVVDTEQTRLGRAQAAAMPEFPLGESGFYPMADGIDALAARLLLAQRAEVSIDVQYYLIKNDIVGRAFVLTLLQAADRGVRVRLLLDDMFTSGYDIGLAALHAHPNFEIRIFNPFRRGAAGRAGSALTEFARINRRMHNKSFTVDNAMTLIGGRNIADEYFGAREDSAFGDLDVLAIGPIVRDVSDMFDLYWNHETALPVPAFVDELDNPQAALDTLRSRFEHSLAEFRESKYAAAVRERVYGYIAEDASIFEWAPYRLVYDSPDKGIKARAGEAASITTGLAESLQGAKHEVIIISPYFVPLNSGVEWLTAIQAKGVDITIITNSLAANNQFTVHSGYAPARKPLLEAGVRIWEVRPDATITGTEFVDASGAKSTLHTKAFIVDRRETFIGSFNFDPRSANINTELGVIIEDPELSTFFAERIDEVSTESAYQVFLNQDGKLRWRGWKDGEEVVFDKEPETSWWTRFKANLVRILPIKRQL